MTNTKAKHSCELGAFYFFGKFTHTKERSPRSQQGAIAFWYTQINRGHPLVEILLHLINFSISIGLSWRAIACRIFSTIAADFGDLTAPI